MANINHTQNNDKARLRKEILANRNRLGYAARVENDHLILMSLQKLEELIQSNHIFCFISLGSEPDTHTLIDWLLAQGKHVYVPKIIKQRQIIAVEFPGWSFLHPGQYGIAEPESSIDVSSEVEVCLTPGVAFDKNGNRLGHGAGYYDKWLEKHSVKHTIAPAYDCQLLDCIPTTQLDKKMGLIVTETRVIRP